MSHVTCVVLGCEDKRSTRHIFPNPERDWERYVKWLDLIGNPKLKDWPPAKVYGSSRVCHRHFTSEDVISNMRLKQTALPSRNLSPDKNRTCVEMPCLHEERMEFRIHKAKVLENYMKKQYGTKDTYDHQPQTINISDCTKPTSYENECVIAQPPKVKMLDNTEDNYNGYEHNYSSTEESALVTDQDNNTSDESVKLKEAKSYLYFVIPENDVEEDKKKEKFQRNRKRQRHTKCPDGTAKFFITIEKAFRHLPKQLQLPLKGEMFESMLKYEKLALEDNHSLLGYSTRRTKN